MSERRQIKKLPVSPHAWEVGLFEVPIEIEGVELEGMVLVVERGSGLVRGGSPLERGASLWSVLGPAMLSPPPPFVPARPKALYCTPPELVRRLRQELRSTGLKVTPAEHLPELQEALDALVGYLTPHRAPGITVEPELWAKTLTLLCRMAPWRELPDSLCFRFGDEIEELADAVALVLGQAGEQEGVVLYPSEEDHLSFLALAHRGILEGIEQLASYNLYLDHPDELDPSEQRAVTELGLELPGARMPRLLAMRAGGGQALSEREQMLFLAALEAILMLCASELEHLVERPCRHQANTMLGKLTVHTTPPQLAPPLFMVAEPALVEPFEHALFLTDLTVSHEDRPAEVLPALVVKLRKRDALRLAEQIAEADGVEVLPGPQTGFRLWAGEEDLGLLCQFPLEPEELHDVLAHPFLAVGISAGGPRRAKLRDEDMVRSMRLPLLGPDTPTRHDPIFDEPPASWPKLSEVLIELARQVLGDEVRKASAEVLEARLQPVVLAWNASVLADFLGDETWLGQLDERDAPFDALVLAKRQQFPGDPRLILELTAREGEGEPIVRIQSTLPPGYEVGGVQER